MTFWYFKAISLNEQNELFISVKYSVCLKPAHLTWPGTHTVVWKKIKGWFSYGLIWSICFWERYSWEKALRSALGSVALAQWQYHVGTFLMLLLKSSCAANPGSFLSWGRSILLQDSWQKRGGPPMWELKFFFFSFTFDWTQNGLWGRAIKYKTVSFANIIY